MKTARKDAARKYPGKAETAARANLAAQLLVDLIRQSALLPKRYGAMAFQSALEALWRKPFNKRNSRYGVNHSINCLACTRRWRA